MAKGDTMPIFGSDEDGLYAAFIMRRYKLLNDAHSAARFVHTLNEYQEVMVGFHIYFLM
jgi:hypothetical protein